MSAWTGGQGLHAPSDVRRALSVQTVLPDASASTMPVATGKQGSATALLQPAGPERIAIFV